MKKLEHLRQVQKLSLQEPSQFVQEVAVPETSISSMAYMMRTRPSHPF